MQLGAVCVGLWVGNCAKVLLVGAVGLWAGSVCFCYFLRREGKFNLSINQVVTK